MQTTYNGEHSIIFGDKDAWTEWGLVPKSRPSVVMPSVRETTLEIPGMNGVLDLSDALLGYPTYGPRSDSWSFYIAHDVNGQTWDETYALIAAHLHGKRRNCILTDDRSYYYTGRFSVGDLSSENMCTEITIGYTLDPFKWMRWTTCEDWPWNPFDFIYGEISQEDFKNIAISGSKTITWTQNQVGNVPVTPTFTVSTDSSLGITVTNSVNGKSKSAVLTSGETTNPLIEFACPNPEDTTTIYLAGTGTVSIDFRPGRL